MTITAAKLRVEIGAETREAEAGMGRVSKGLTQLGSVGQVALGTVLGGAIMQSGRQLMGLGGEALGAYASFERMGMSLQQLAAKERLNTGEAQTMQAALAQTKDTAKELQGWIQKLAIESPFTSSGVADAFKMAMAYGFTTEEAKRLTQAMIDFAAGSGATESTMGRVALALGQIQAKGKLAGQEVLQLTESGIAVDAILAQAFGKSTAEIIAMREKGLIPADQAIEAIVTSLETDFGGAAARQTTTVAGLVSSLGDIKEIGLREFFGGVFREFQPDLAAFVSKLQEPETLEAIRGWGTELANFTREVVTSGGEVLRWFSNLEEGTRGIALGLGVIAFNAGKATRLMVGLYEVAIGLPAAITGITVAWKAWNSGLTLTSALGVAGIAPMAQTLGGIALAAGALVGIWVTWNEKIEKIGRLGAAGVTGKIGEDLHKLRAAGASAIEITDTFIEKQKIVDDQINKQGLMGGFVNRFALSATNLGELANQLEKTGLSYKEYISLVTKAAEASGLQVAQTEDGIRVYKRVAGRMVDLTEQVGLQSEAQINNAHSVHEAGKTYYQLTEAQREMLTGSGAVIGALEEQGAAAEEAALKMQALGDSLRTIVSGQFGEENDQFKEQQERIRGEITETQGAIDDLNGKTWLTEAQKGQLDDLKKKLEDLQTELDETAKAHEEAMRRMAFNMLMERASSDGLTENEVNNLTTLAEQWGLYDQATANVVRGVNDNLGLLDTEKPEELFNVLSDILALPDGKEFVYTIRTEYLGLPPGDGGGATSRAGADADLAESLTSNAQIGVLAIEELNTAIGEAQTAFQNAGQVGVQSVESIGATLPPVDGAVEVTKGKVQALKDVWYSINSRYLRFDVDVSIDPDFALLAGLGGLGGAGGRDTGNEDLLPERASGGPVRGGRPYLVGERGQELFIPAQNGQIVNAQQTSQLLAAMAEQPRGGGVAVYFMPGSIVGAPGQDTEELALEIIEMIQDRVR